MPEQNRKTLRSFYCRDYLWELFEVMTRDLGCSMDYLINEAMRHYARSRNYSLSAQPGQESGYGGYSNRSFSAKDPSGPPPPPGGYAQGGAYYGASGYGRAPEPQPQAQKPPAQPPAQPPPPRQEAPARTPEPPVSPAQPSLYLLFNGQRYSIDKEKFIIGRGSQLTDLTIRDGNISRKHAAVIYRGSKYYIKDLDSTNGIEFQGGRIDSKKIEEGDVFHICDYELSFTYQP